MPAFLVLGSMLVNQESFAQGAKQTVAKFDGYIIKYKKNSAPRSFTALDLETQEFVSTSFGDFAVVKTPQAFTGEKLQLLQEQNEIEYIEPNYIFQPLDVPVRNLPPEIKDREFSSQWYLNNTGTNNWFNMPAGVDVNAVNAWKITTGSKQVKIAVIDSGIKYNHPDLKDNMWVNEKELHGAAGVDDDQNGYVDDIYGYDFANNDGDPMDDVGHGTEVTGIISAAHNDTGIRGVMGSVQIMAIKFLIPGGGVTLNAVKGIEYAIKNGAQIINLSWGGGEYTQALSDAIKAAGEKNILVVAAAGNSKGDNDLKPLYPATYGHPNIISVGSTSPNDLKSGFSNFGKKSVHVFAPGLYILSTDFKDTTLWSSGTSLSAPLVTGAAGLALSLNNKLTALQLKEKIIQTSIKNPELSKIGQGGRLDIYELLKVVQ